MGFLLHALFQGIKKDPELEWHFRDEREINILAGDRRACRDEASVAPHQFYESYSAGNTARFRVCAIEHVFSFIDGGEKAECARDETDIVVDCFGNSDN